MRVVWRRWWLLALMTLVAAGVTYGLNSRLPPVYRSTTRLEVGQASSPNEQAYVSIINAERLAGTYVRQVASQTVIDKVVERMGLTMSVGKLQGMITARQVGDTNLLEISVEHTDPAFAQALAATTAQVFIEQKTTQQQARYQDQLAELENLVAELERSIAEIRAEIAALGDPNTLSAYGRAELARLESQLSNDQTRLNVYLSSTEQFRLAMARSGNYLTVFSPANFPGSPVGPQVMRNTATAGAAGLVVGLSVAFLLEYLDDKIRSPEEARRALDVNVLAAIPKVQEEAEWFANEHPLSPATEALRSLRTSLQFASLDTPVRSLLVTSALPTEGKSFTAANLAAVMAQGGKSVVLVDADLRHPTVHKFVGVDTKPGLSDALLTLTERENQGLDMDVVDDLIQETSLDGLWVVPCGTHVQTPSELLSSEVFKGFLRLLQECCDVVIVDSPPVMAVTDPVILSTMVDGVAVVVNAGESRIPVVGQALQRLNEVDAKVLGVVVNRMTSRSGSYYYYDYYRGYYGREHEKKGWMGIRFGGNGSSEKHREVEMEGARE